MSRKRVSNFFIAFIILSFFTLMVIKNFRIDNLSASVLDSFSGDRIHFINVGNGDSILIESNGKYGLIDAGKEGAKVYNYLKLVMGNKKLDFLLLTHAHNDHYGGIFDVIDGVKSGSKTVTQSYVSSKTTVYIGEYRGTGSDNKAAQADVIRKSLAKGAKVIEFYGGPDKGYQITKIDSSGKKSKSSKPIAGANSFTLKNFKIYLMNLEKDSATLANKDPNGDDNRNSIISLVTHTPSGKKALLMADTEVDDEERLICTAAAQAANECRTRKVGDKTESQIIKNVDIIKLGHHGTFTSSQISFLKFVKPKMAIVSIAAENPENANSLNMNSIRYLDESGTKVYQTAYDIKTFIDFTATDAATRAKRSILATFTSSGIKMTNAENKSLSPLKVFKGNSSSGFPHWTTITWNNKDAKMYYKSTNNPANSMTKISNNCYMFHPFSNIQLKGWVQVDGHFFYFESGSGARISGTDKEINESAVSTEKYTFNSGTSCDSANGYLIKAKSWSGNSGFLKTSSTRWFYLKDSEVQTGWQTITVKVNKKNVKAKYYFKTADKFDKYKDNGLIKVGLTTLSSGSEKYVYYFDETVGDTYGMMKTGIATTKSGDTYYFDESNGRRKTGWITIGNKSYYFNTSNAKIVTGLSKIDGDWYYMNPTATSKLSLGEKLYGWQKINKKYYYFNTSTGKMVTGLQKIDGKWYYLQTASDGSSVEGVRLTNAYKTIGGLKLYFNSNGYTTGLKGIVDKPTASKYCSNKTYNGKAQTITKKAGTGYSFTNYSKTNAGTYTITAKLKTGYIWSNYTSGNATFKCSIAAKGISGVSITVPNVEYTGGVLKPAITVKDGSTTLSTSNYKVSYSNNVQVGKGKVTITGKGNYSGTKITTFNITAKSVSNLTITVPNVEYTGGVLKPAITVKDGSSTVGSSNYSISYTNNVNAGTGTVTIKGKGSYSGSKSANFKISARNISGATVIVPKSIYTGKALKPTVTVKDGSTTLSTSNYTASYSNNVDVGTGVVTITGKGNYTGTKTVSFVIESIDIHIIDTDIMFFEDDYLKMKNKKNVLYKKSELLSNIEDTTGITVYDIDGTEMTTDDYLGTGSKIKNGNEEYTIISYGDVNKDGKISLLDIMTIYNYMCDSAKGRTSSLSTIQILAGDMNGDGKLNLPDIMRIYNIMSSNKN